MGMAVPRYVSQGAWVAFRICFAENEYSRREGMGRWSKTANLLFSCINDAFKSSKVVKKLAASSRAAACQDRTTEVQP